MSFGLLFLVSIVAGLVGALSGMGAGVVLIPALTFFGIDIKQALAASNISVIALSSSAAPGYVRRHMPNFKAGAFVEAFAVLGAFIGALLTLASGRRLLFFLCGGILIASWILLRKRQGPFRPILQQDPFSRWLRLDGCYYDHAEGRTVIYQGTRAALAGLLSFGAGLITGLLGVGGSALTVLILEGVMGLPTKVSLTTSNLIIGVIAMAGTNVYLEAGLLNPQMVAPLILGVPLGALIGSKWLVRLQNRIVRYFLLTVLVLWGMGLILHGIRGGS